MPLNLPSNLQLPGNMNWTDPAAAGASSAMYNQDFLNAVKGSSVTPYTGGDAFGYAKSLLSPGGGGMSPDLMTLLGIGNQQIEQRTQGAVASTMSDSLKRGMEGSSIEMAGIQGDKATGEASKNSLLASLLGMQHQDTTTLAQGALQGAAAEFGLSEQELTQLLQFFSGQSDNAMNTGMFAYGTQESAYQSKLDRNQATNDAWIGFAGNVVSGVGGAAVKKYG